MNPPYVEISAIRSLLSDFTVSRSRSVPLSPRLRVSGSGAREHDTVTNNRHPRQHRQLLDPLGPHQREQLRGHVA